MRDDLIEVKASDLRLGDLVDLEGGEFFKDNPIVEYEFGIVSEIVPEAKDCIAVYFENVGGAGYDPDHVFKVQRRELAPQGWYEKFNA